MNEELTPLDALKSLRCAISLGLGTAYEEMNNKCDIIETALKRLAVYETFGLLDETDDVDKLTDIKGKLTYVDKVMDTQERLLASVSGDEIRILSSVLNSQIRKLKKKLETLEIIKSFNDYQIVEVQGQWYLMRGIEFGKSIKMPITKEQADILKEVLS